MVNPRRPVLWIALVATTVCGAASTLRAAPVLPEVKKHLAAAHKCLASGSYESAAAHADLVLIADDVSVSVNVDSIRASQRNRCVQALQACLETWESALDDTVRFHLEDDPAKADLKVVFRTDVRMKREPIAGLTNWTRTISANGKKVSAKFKADIQVRTQDLQYHGLSFEVMRQEAEHEFGHVLGLEDSNIVGDLMGELDMDHVVACPSNAEIQTVKDLRLEAKRIKADAELKVRHENVSS